MYTFKVTQVTDGGNSRVNVTLAQVIDSIENLAYVNANMLTLNLDTDEADSGGYYPGRQFTVSVEQVASDV